MHSLGLSLTADVGGRSAKIAISTTSAQSAVYGTNSSGATVLITPDVNCFFRAGTNPVAVADGTDMYLTAGTTYRVQIGVAQKLAFIALTGTGNVYITPELGS